MKKTTKRLVIFLVCFVMLLTAVAVAVSAKGAAVPPVNDGEIINEDGSITTKYGNIPKEYADPEKYPFVVFKFKNDILSANDTSVFDHMGVAINNAKTWTSYNTATNAYTAVVYMRKDYTTTKESSTAESGEKGDKFDNWAQNEKLITLDLNGYTLTQGAGTTGVFTPVTNKPMSGRVFDSVYTVKNGYIVVDTAPAVHANMWNPLYLDKNRAAVTLVYDQKGNRVTDVKPVKIEGTDNYQLVSLDGTKTYCAVDGEGKVSNPLYHDKTQTNPVQYPITHSSVTMADKDFTWNFENVNFSFKEGATATNLLLDYYEPQYGSNTNPPTSVAPYYFNYVNCTFDMTNAPTVDKKGQTVKATLFNAAPDSTYFLKTAVNVEGCEIIAYKTYVDEEGKTVEKKIDFDDFILYTEENVNGSSVDFRPNANGEYITVVLAPTDSISAPAPAVGESYAKNGETELYWHKLDNADNTYVLEKCYIAGKDHGVCVCGTRGTCTDANDDHFCDVEGCGAEKYGKEWLPEWHEKWTKEEYPFAVVDASGNFLDKYENYGAAILAVKNKNDYVIELRRDYILQEIDRNGNNLQEHGGHFTIDLNGYTITRVPSTVYNTYLFDNFCDVSTTADAVNVTFKNGTLNAEQWLICLSGGEGMTTEKDINFEFTNVTFKLDEINTRTSGWVIAVHNREYNHNITSNIVFDECTFDMSEMNDTFYMDKAPIVDLDMTNKKGEDWIRVDVKFKGGEIIAKRFETKALIHYHDGENGTLKDTVTFETGSDGEYMKLTMVGEDSADRVPHLNSIPNHLQIDGKTAYFHDGVVNAENTETTYTLSPCGDLVEYHTGTCGCIVEDTCMENSNGELCDFCYNVFGYFKQKYGIDTIPVEFASPEEYPFFILIKNGDTYSFAYAARDFYGKQSTYSAIGRAKNVLGNNNKYDLSIGDYVPEKNGGSVVDVVIVMRRDYDMKKGNSSNQTDEYYNNIAHAQGHVIIDFDGHVLSEAMGSTSTLFYVTAKGWPDSGDKVFTFPSTYTFKNGNIKVRNFAFAAVGSTDKIEENAGWFIRNSVINLNFEDINFGFASKDATTAALVYQTQDASATNLYNGVAKVNVNLTDCEFDFVTFAPTNPITIINNDTTGKDVDCDIVVNGCTILASDMSNVKVYESSDTNGSSVVIDKKEITLKMPRGTMPPEITNSVIVDSGEEYSFVRSSVVDGEDIYILSPTALIGFNLKTNVSLYTNFTYNIEVPTTAYVRAITVNGIDIMTASEIVLANAGIKVIDRGNSYLISVSIPAGNTLNDIPVTVTFTSGTTTLTATYTLSVLEYAKSIIGGKYNEISKTLMKDILVYAYNAHNYFGTNANVKNKLTEIENMLSSYIRKLPTDTSKNSIKNAYFKEVAIYVDETSAFRFYLANSNYTKDDFTFKVGGKTENVVVTQGSDYVQVEVPAYLMLSDVTVTCGETEVGTYNLFSYYDFAVGEKDAKLVRLVESLMKYSVSAKEYRDYIVSGGFGSMFIDAPQLIYPNTPGFNITALFSNGSYYGNVTWSTNHPNVFVEDGKIYAVGNFASETPVTVTAMTEHHTASVNVTVVATNSQTYKYVENASSGASGGEISSTGIYLMENDKNITGEFVIKGKLNIYDVNTESGNAQIQFRFKRYWRFLMQDKDSDGIFTLRTYYNDSIIAETAEIYDARNGLTLDWAVVVSGTTAYLYFDGALVSTLDVTGVEYFNLGALRADVLFYDIELKTKASDEAAYNAAVSEYQHYVNNAERTEGYINDTANVFKDNAGNNLSGDYVVRGSFRIDKLSTTNDPHIQFRFHDKHKFLLMDGNGTDPNDGIYDVIEFVGDNATVPKDNFYNSNTSKVLEWAVVVKDETAYLYLNNQHVGTIDLSGVANLYFNVGALYMDVLFYNFEVVIKAENEAEYNALVEKYL